MGGSPEAFRVLYVDGDRQFVDPLAAFLEDERVGFEVETATSATEALEHIDREPVDCVVTDSDVPGADTGGFLEAVRETDDDLPLILVTDRECEAVITAAVEYDVSHYLRKEAVVEQQRLLAHHIETAVGRFRTERLAARLDDVRSLLTDVNRALVRLPAPSEIERTLCDLVADVERNRSAWIGTYEAGSRTVTPDTAVGVELEALETVEIPSEGTHTEERPIVRAVQTRELAVDEDASLEAPVASAGDECDTGYRARAVVPLAHEDRLYGVLVVTTDEPLAFGDRERTLLAELGDDVGQAFRSQRTRRRLRGEHERRTALFENAPRPIIEGVLSDDGEYLVRDVNDAFERVFGFDAEDVIGRDVADAVVPEAVRPEHEAFRDRVRSGESVTAQAERLTEHGSHEFLLDLVPYGVGKESVDGWYAWYTDITEQTERERELRQIIEQMNDAVFVHRPNGTFLAVNQAAIDRYGYDESEFLNLTPRDLDDETYVDRIPERQHEILDGGNAVFETVHRTSDGERVPVEINSSRIRFRGDAAILSIARDVSERTEQARKRQRFEQAAEASGHAIYITDPDGTIEYVNPAFEDITGFPATEAIGRTPRILKSGEMSDEYYEQLWETLLEGNVWEEELVNRRNDGELYHAHQTIAPITDGTGDVQAFVAVQADITERKSRERRLEELTERLQETTRRHDMALEATETGIWLWDFERGEVTPYGKTTDLFGVDPDERDVEAYAEQIRREDLDDVEAAVARAIESAEEPTVEFRIRTDGPERWVHAQGTLLEDESGTPERMLGVVTDISVRKRREAKLERRERKVRQLHATTRDLLTLDGESAVFERVAEAMAVVLGFEFFRVLRFDDETGTLETFATSPSVSEMTDRTVSIDPGDDSIWTVFRDGETELFDALPRPDLFADLDESKTNLLAVPIGDFGVILTALPSEDTTSPGDVGLIELLATNARAVLHRIRQERELGEASRLLSTQDTRIDELEGLIDTIRTIQRRVANSETREALETVACEELVNTDRVDFAWIGRPGAVDAELSPTAWVGDDRGYLDGVPLDGSDESLPSQRAANRVETVNISNVARWVHDDRWAKEALSREFRSVLSVPLVHDQVLYGVLTAYSRQESAFDEMHEAVFEDAGSILVNYLNILNIRRSDSSEAFVEIEFEVAEPSHPLGTLASETGCTIRFDTVAETRPDDVRLLVTVLDGDPETVMDHANRTMNVGGAGWFGDEEHGQLTVTVGKPFLAATVTNHGGRLIDVIAAPDSTRLRVHLPANATERPLIEALTERFGDVELVSRREVDGPSGRPGTDPESLLTDRQREVLRAAYHGGYYETPRGVTGEDLADSFGISNSVIYDHLQAAHRTLLETVFDSPADDAGRNL